jgi:hypothetical protein
MGETEGRSGHDGDGPSEGIEVLSDRLWVGLVC